MKIAFDNQIVIIVILTIVSAIFAEVLGGIISKAIEWFLKQKGWITKIVISILLVGGLFTSVYFLQIIPPSPSVNTTILTIPVTDVVTILDGLYDDFNSMTYDGEINAAIWKRLQETSCDLFQADGKAIFASVNQVSDNTRCVLRIPNEVSLEQIGALESTILVEEDAAGGMSLVTIEYQGIGFQADTIWIAQCGILQNPNENQLEIFFYINNSYPNDGVEIYESIEAMYGKRYKLQLEIDPVTAAVRCYLDGKVFASHSPENEDQLKSKLLYQQITGFWSTQSKGTFALDDVVLKP